MPARAKCYVPFISARKLAVTWRFPAFPNLPGSVWPIFNFYNLNTSNIKGRHWTRSWTGAIHLLSPEEICEIQRHIIFTSRSWSFKRKFSYENTVAYRPVAGQWAAQQRKCCWKQCFLCGPLRGDITWPTEFSSVSECSAVEYSGVKWVGWWVRGLLRYSRCELLLWEAGSWGTRQFGNPKEKERLPLEAATKQRLMKTWLWQYCMRSMSLVTCLSNPIHHPRNTRWPA
jgi:hypothetical protein